MAAREAARLDPRRSRRARAADPLASVELERVLAALALLPALDRDVLSLRAEAELSFDEIAAITGLSAEAARLRLHRARKRLIEVL